MEAIMPGVNVTTTVRTGPAGTNNEVAGQVFMVGTAERGSTTEPTLLRSFSDYTTYYGNYQSGNLYSHVKTFFDEGGSRCYVFRVYNYDDTGEDVASTSSIDLTDSSGSATMTLTSKNVGAWGNNLSVAVENSDDDGNILTGYFRLKISLDGELLLSTRDLLDVDDAVNVINTSIVKHLVTAADETTSSSDPDSLADTNFSGGQDGSAVTADHIVDALDGTFDSDPDVTTCFSVNLKDGAVAAPGYTGSAVWNALRTHAANNNRIALCGFTLGDSSANAKTSASSYYSDANAKHMAFYWPHIKVTSPNAAELATGESTVTTATINLSPESYAAAARSKGIAAAGGPWRAGAGQISAAKSIVDLYQDVTPATAETLDKARVNAIRKVNNSIRVYGARSASNDETNWRYITQQDTMNYIAVRIEERMESFVFSTIDSRGNLFGLIRASIKGFLKGVALQDGLYAAYDVEGAQVDPGYTVSVSAANNPNSQLATGLVKATVGVRVSGVADLIDIVITKSNLSDPLV
jgi:hypothetical protein